MKIEKLNENRIQITFNNSYLQENNIDIHTFMSNSIESQSLFLNMLNEAEDKIGFITDNYKLSIEVLALSNGVFVITVTRLEKENLKSVHVHAKRKSIPQVSKKQLFKFNNFDNLCNFEFISFIYRIFFYSKYIIQLQELFLLAYKQYKSIASFNNFKYCK